MLTLVRKNLILLKSLWRKFISTRNWTGQKFQDNIKSITMDIKELVIGEKEIKLDINKTFTLGYIIKIEGISGSGKSYLAKSIVKFIKVNKI